MYNICESENRVNYNNKIFGIMQKKELSNNNYYYHEKNNKQNNDKFKNIRKFQKHHKSNSLDKINIDNIYFLNKELSYYNNNYNDEDLDIELDAISKKIPINDFYIDNNDLEEKYINIDYSEKKANLLRNENNKFEFKTCSPSPLVKKRNQKYKDI